MIKKFLFIFVVFLSSQVSGSNRGVSLSITTQDGQQIALYKESHALIIGISDYSNGWPKLPGVKLDVQLVRDALEKNGFHVVLVENPTKPEMVNAFEDFIKSYGGEPDNRLLFYFAGHGHSIKPKYGGEPIGYIVPIEAPNPNTDLFGFKRISVSMQRIEEYALNIDAKHTLFLFDSCFSGSLFSLSRAIPEHISYKTSQPVRQFITAGNADETVPDVSIFRQQFVAALAGEGDANKDGFVTGSELGEFLQTQVTNYSKGAQHPQYGKIRHPKLDKGDFVFQLSSRAALSPTSVVVAQVAQIISKHDAESEMWGLIKTTTDVTDIEDFLAAFPTGDFSALARLKMKQLNRNAMSQLAAAKSGANNVETKGGLVFLPGQRRVPTRAESAMSDGPESDQQVIEGNVGLVFEGMFGGGSGISPNQALFDEPENFSSMTEESGFSLLQIFETQKIERNGQFTSMFCSVFEEHPDYTIIGSVDGALRSLARQDRFWIVHPRSQGYMRNLIASVLRNQFLMELAFDMFAEGLAEQIVFECMVSHDVKVLRKLQTRLWASLPYFDGIGMGLNRLRDKSCRGGDYFYWGSVGRENGTYQLCPFGNALREFDQNIDPTMVRNYAQRFFELIDAKVGELQLPR